MLQPTLPGWKAETIGDDIAWMRFGDDGRLYAVNPEAGFFGVAPGTSVETNDNAIETLGQHHLHQRGPDRRRRRLVGGPDRRAPGAPDRLAGQTGRPHSGTPAAHPNARFTVPAAPVPDDRAGMGRPGRRADLGHPVRRPPRHRRAAGDRGLSTGRTACSWAPTSPRKAPPRPTAIGQLRRDPFAMLPFCGYNMGDYFGHWLKMGDKADAGASCRASTSSTGSARTTTASSSGRATATTPAC